MSADRFTATVADTRLGPDQQTGRNLMRTAVRLLAHGKPVTVAEVATAVISIPGSQEMDITRVRATTCNPGRYFATAQAAEDWLARYPDGTVMPVADAYPQLRPISNRLLDPPQTPSC